MSMRDKLDKISEPADLFPNHHTLTFEQFMNLYDNWNGTTKVNDDNLNTIVIGNTLEIMECIPLINGVENYGKLFKMEVVSFGFYDDELCVRVREVNNDVQEC